MTNFRIKETTDGKHEGLSIPLGQTLSTGDITLELVIQLCKQLYGPLFVPVELQKDGESIRILNSNYSIIGELEHG
ncbi:MAG: hypothetical protein AAFW67_13750 [Cyanobacteria bacterium J06638_38]